MNINILKMIKVMQ